MDGSYEIPQCAKDAISRMIMEYGEGVLGYPVLDGIDYVHRLVDYPSELQNAFVVFMNGIRFDGDGRMLNEREMHRRAAQYIRAFLDPKYVIDPPPIDGECRL